MNESKNLKSQWMKLCKRSRSKSRQIWVIDRDRDQESWINRDRDEKCDFTGTGIAQNCQSRYRNSWYRESRSITALVLAGALNKLRWTKTISLDRPVPPITIAGLPLDTEYADDVDVNDEEQENLGAILPQATAILEKWNLFVNEDKTDFTHAYLSSMGEVDSDGNL